MSEAGKGQQTMEQNRDQWVMLLGRLIRESRRDRFTVEELAALAGVSSGLVSQLERGIGNPSFMTLLRIADALNLPIGALFQGPEIDPREMIVRRGERASLAVPADGVVHEILTPDLHSKLGIVRSTLPPGFSNADEPYVHQGEETLLVIEGTLTGLVAGQPFELHEGDTITYDSGIPHSLANATEEPVELLAISTPPASGGPH